MRGAGVGRLNAPFAAANLFRVPPCRFRIDSAARPFARAPSGHHGFRVRAYRGDEAWHTRGAAACATRERQFRDAGRAVTAAAARRSSDQHVTRKAGNESTGTGDTLGHDDDVVVVATSSSTASAWSKNAPENGFAETEVVPKKRRARRPGAVMWFRQDLRLHDNQAFHAAVRYAVKNGGELVCVFLWSDSEDGDSANPKSWPPGGASRVWLANALASLDNDLRNKYGSETGLIFVKGSSGLALQALCAAVDANQVFASERFEPAQVASDANVRKELALCFGEEKETEPENGIDLTSFPGHLLFAPSATQIDMTNETYFFGTLMPFIHAAHDTGGTPGVPKSAPLSAPLVGVTKESAKKFAERLAAELSTVNKTPGLDSDAYEKIDCANYLRNQTQVQVVPDVHALGVLPESDVKHDWSRGIRGAWDISEFGANESWRVFVTQNLEKYETDANLTDDANTAVSKLSPYLRFGQISPRAMYHELSVEKKKGRATSRTFHHRMYRREFAYWQLHHWPDLPTQSVRAHYESRDDWRLKWSETGYAPLGAPSTSQKTQQRLPRDESETSNEDQNGSSPGADADAEADADALESLRRWRAGTTGFPAIDVGMRRLQQTGWMHQQERMLCATFLTDYLGVDWRYGASWFHSHLVDADLAVNNMMWQNAGKSGLDQWDVFSGGLVPDGSVRGHDPKGVSVGKWIPELNGLPEGHLRFKPWEASEKTLHNANLTISDEGVVNGRSSLEKDPESSTATQVYPRRILRDAEASRERMVQGVTAIRAEHARAAIARCEMESSESRDTMDDNSTDEKSVTLTPNLDRKKVTDVLVDVRTCADYVSVPRGASLLDSHFQKLLPVSTRKEFKKALRGVFSLNFSKHTMDKVRDWAGDSLDVGITAASASPSSDESGFARACDIGKKRSARAEKDGTAHAHSHSHGGVTHSHSHGGHSHLPNDAIGGAHIGHTHGVGVSNFGNRSEGKGAGFGKGKANPASGEKKGKAKVLKSSSWAAGRGSGATRRAQAKETTRAAVKAGRRETRELAAWSSGTKVGDSYGGDEDEDED